MSKQKFQIGDKVVVNDKYRKQSYGIGTVVDIDRVIVDDEILIPADSHEPIHTPSTRKLYVVVFEEDDMHRLFYSYELEKYGEKIKRNNMSKRKFSVGDKVRSVSDPEMVGEVTYIIESQKVSSHRPIYHVTFIDNTYRNCYSYELQHASKFKKGDKVTFTSQAKQWLIDHGYQSEIDPDIPYTISSVYKSGDYEGYKYEFVGVDCIVATDDDLKLYDESKEGLTIDEVMYNPRDEIMFNFNQRTDRMKKWVDICNEYLKEFCDRHCYTYHPCDWIGGEVGGIIEINDMFVNMDNIRYDVDNEVPVEKFSDWYWNSVEHSELGLKYMNYPSYCKGAPDPYTQEQIQSIREGQMRIRQAKEDLRKTMDELGGDFNKLLF